MKKIIITILTLALIITAFASCTKIETETTTYEPVIEFPTEEITSEEVTTEVSTTENIMVEAPVVDGYTETTTETSTTEVPTTKEPEITQKSETTTKAPEVTTEEVATQPEETTTKQEETITAAPVININKMGGEYSPERAGLLYNDARALSTYEDIKEGDFYYEYDENGNRERKQKPYSPGNEPEPKTCDFCGKLVKPYDGKHYGCYYDGYCSRFYVDINCPECGEFVNANTCHSCKN